MTHKLWNPKNWISYVSSLNFAKVCIIHTLCITLCISPALRRGLACNFGMKMNYEIHRIYIVLFGIPKEEKLIFAHIPLDIQTFDPVESTGYLLQVCFQNKKKTKLISFLKKKFAKTMIYWEKQYPIKRGKKQFKFFF